MSLGVVFAALLVSLSLTASAGAQCAPTTDCNGNGVLDSCDLTDGTSDDCDGNGIPDECDIALGTAEDCDLNGIPDSCEPIAEVILAPGPGGSLRGSAIAAEGDRIVVGDRGADTPVLDLGAARVYRRVGTQWVEEDTLLPSDMFTSSLDFGTSVAIEGDLIAIGAPGDGNFLAPRRGAIYIFRLVGGVWQQEQKIPSPSTTNFAEFGKSVAIDGGTVFAGAWRNAVGSISSGSVFVFSFDGATWTEETELVPASRSTDARFGIALATSAGRLAVGASGDLAGATSTAGAVSIFERVGGVFTELEKITSPTPEASGEFGRSVSFEGTRLVVGAPGEALLRGSAHVFSSVGSGAILDATLSGLDSLGGDAFGTAVSLSEDVALVGAPLAGGTGKSYVFTAAAGAWTEIEAHTPAVAASGDEFGAAVAMSTAFGLVGAPFGSFVSVREIVPPVDCDGDLIEDPCAIAAGLVADCNLDLVPDSCQIVTGELSDCDLDGVPDSCQIASGTGGDCNQNGVLDSCDIAAGTSLDCDANGIPDACDPDCNANGTPDACDLIAGTSSDCDGNSIPDSCDIASGTALDCDGNLVPDSCDLANGAADCNGNGVPDSCELIAGTAFDCDLNGVLDSCDIAAGAADCDENGVPDTCDAAGGGSPDTIPPTFSQVPADISIAADLGACSATVSWIEPIASDSCQLDLVTQTHTPGSAFPVGTTTVSYTATDAAGNSTTVDFIVTVSDEEAPTIRGLPVSVTLPNDVGACGAIVSWVDPTVQDACPAATLSLDVAAGSLFAIGTTVVTATATDAAGNQTVESFTVTVEDLEAPTLSGVPTDLVVGNDAGLCGAIVSWAAPVAIDNCPGAVASTDIASGTLFPIGTSTVTVTATDAGGLTISALFSVTVTDDELPLLPASLPEIATGNDPGLCGAAVVLADPSVTDNCPGVTLTADFVSGSVFPIGSTLVTFTATDTAGHQATVTQLVTVADVEAPVISGVPADLTLDNDLGACGAVATWTPPTSTDACGPPTLVADFLPGAFFPVGTTTVGYTATDTSGNPTTASFTVTVNDTEAPSFPTSPLDLSLASEPGLCGATGVFDLPTAIDACSTPTVSANHTSGEVFPLGVTTVTVTATDAAGNATEISFTVTVTDLTPPTIDGLPTDILLPAEIGECGAVATWTDPTVSDDCPGSVIGLSHGAGGFFPVGTTTVTVTAVDAGGSTTIATFDVTVIDSEGPMITGLTDVTVVPVFGECTASVTVPMPAVHDPCGVVLLTNNATGTNNASGIYPAGVTVVTWTATDGVGNVSTATQSITVDVPLVDCNGNGTPDNCDIGMGTSFDCNSNGVPDECDLAAGTSLDIDGDQIPDECQDLFVRGDANADGAIDISDPILVLFHLFAGQGVACLDALDVGDDDLVDIADPILLLSYIFEGGPPPAAPFPLCGPEGNVSLGCDGGLCP